MTKGFASTTDMDEKKITFSEIGTDLYAFTAEGDVCWPRQRGRSGWVTTATTVPTA